MKQTVPCSQCSEEAVALLANQPYCPGCLMRILACEDDALSLHRLDSVPPNRSAEKEEAPQTI